MASHVLRELHVKTESAFTENAASVSSNTYTARVPVLSIDSPQPEHPRIDNGALLSRQNDSEPGLLGVRSAVLEFSALWGGHCTTTVGALSETWLQDLLSDGLGGGTPPPSARAQGGAPGPPRRSTSRARASARGARWFGWGPRATARKTARQRWSPALLATRTLCSTRCPR